MTATDKLTQLLNNHAKDQNEIFTKFYKTIEINKISNEKNNMKKHQCKNIQKKGSWNKLK